MIGFEVLLDAMRMFLTKLQKLIKIEKSALFPQNS